MKTILLLSFFIGAGFCFKYMLVGYSFTAYLLFGCAGIVLLFWLLDMLKAKKVKRIVAFLLTIVLVLYGVTEYFIIADSFGDEETADYLVVLGAGVNGTEPSLSLRNRLEAALGYLNAHPGTLCIASGGQGGGEDISEAQCIYNWLTDHGVSEERVFMEERATTTEENVEYSLDIINKLGGRGKPVAVASSEYHVHRAKLMFKSHGVAAVGVPGRTTKPMLMINYFLREAPAVWVYIATRLFG